MAKASKKNSILSGARALFAEKGYDATGMDEIASTLGIPKSLIYYHFKSKEDLLNTIIADFLAEYQQILLDGSMHGIDKISVYIDFLKRNRDCAKILLSESLKAGSNNTLIFKTLSPLMDIDKNQPDGEPMDNAHWLTEFFTSILPSILFACYEENWSRYFGVSAEQLLKDYCIAYKQTHGAYHNQIQKESL